MRAMFVLGTVFGVGLTGFVTALMVEIGELPPWPGTLSRLALGLSAVLVLGAMTASHLCVRSFELRDA